MSLLEADATEKALSDAIRSENAPPADPAPAPASEPTPEPAVETPKVAEPAPTTPAPEAKKPEERPRLVPHQALHEERERRKQIERELAELKKPAPQMPDETQDPIGTIAALKQQLADFQRQQQQQAEFQALAQKARASGQERFNAHPEYAEQEKFVGDIRRRQLEVVGTPPHMIETVLGNEVLALVKQAEANDTTYADMVANLAVAMGWQPKAAAPIATPAPAAPPAPAPNVVKEAEAVIDRLERGQKAATSPSRSGGGAPQTGELTIEDILKLDGAAFDKASTAFIRRERRAGG